MQQLKVQVENTYVDEKIQVVWKPSDPFQCEGAGSGGYNYIQLTDSGVNIKLLKIFFTDGKW